MAPVYIDGRIPAAVTTLEASIGVQTPYIQEAPGTPLLEVPNDGPDTFVIMTSTQTMLNKTMVSPFLQTPDISSGTLTEPSVYSGTFYSGTFNSPILTSPQLTGQMSGGILNNVVFGAQPLKTLTTSAAGGSKTIDLSTGNVFIVQLTGACTLTVSNANAGKSYLVVVQQDIADSYTDMSWMTGFINGFVDSGPTQRTGAIDVYQVIYDGTNHIGIGGKDVQ